MLFDDSITTLKATGSTSGKCLRYITVRYVDKRDDALKGVTVTR